MTEHPFHKHINSFVSLTDTDFQTILTFFKEQHFQKKELLLGAGDICNNNFFVVKGCLHMYFINDRGTERTVQFAIENWWLTDFLAFQKQSASEFYVRAIEDTDVLSIRHNNLEALLEQFPIMERYFKSIYRIAYGSSLYRTKYLFDFSKEEIYFHFVDHFPEFAQRVPQYLIASFLGLTPEYVSEIRAKKRS